jgi:hypothetical protein
MRRWVIAEADQAAILCDRKGVIRTARYPAGAVVDIPRFIVGYFALIIPGRDVGGREAVDAIAIRVLQPRAQAVRLPVARAADLALEVPGTVAMILLWLSVIQCVL